MSTAVFCFPRTLLNYLTLTKEAPILIIILEHAYTIRSYVHPTMEPRSMIICNISYYLLVRQGFVRLVRAPFIKRHFNFLKRLFSIKMLKFSVVDKSLLKRSKS